MNVLTMDKELIQWAIGGLEGYRSIHPFLLLQQEGQEAVHMPIKKLLTYTVKPTTCRVYINAQESRIEIDSERDLSALMRNARTKILYALGDTAFVGYVSDCSHDSESGLYEIRGDVVSMPIAGHPAITVDHKA